MRKTANIELEARSLDLLLELFCDPAYARYRFSADFLNGLETKVRVHIAYLKIETDHYRVWITGNDTVIIEKAGEVRWEKVLEYKGGEV